MLTGLGVFGLGLLWDLLDQFGLAPSTAVLELLANAALGLCLSLPQFIVLRVLLRHTSGAARAWIPVTTLVFTAEYFVDAYWFRGAGSTIAFVAGTAEGAILAIAQGMLLAEMRRMRSATWIWLAGMTAFYLVVIGSSLVPVPMSDWLAGLIFGFAYGAITGAAMTLIVRRSARREPSPA